MPPKTPESMLFFISSSRHKYTITFVQLCFTSDRCFVENKHTFEN